MSSHAGRRGTRWDRYDETMLKTLTKVIAVMGGAAAILWAMRDRLVSISTSREPEPPMFRTSDEVGVRGVDSIDGIGPTYANRLAVAGIDSVASLATASPDKVAEAAGVSGARARAWIEQAQQSE